MRKVLRDLTGLRFGRLVVLGVDDNGKRKTSFVCQCDCGNVKSIRADALISGATVSCGCRKKEQDAFNLTANHSHKMSGSRIYGIWQGIKDRCANENNPRYFRYGGRGIVVCDEWKNNFTAFYEWAVKNGYQDTLSIDRIDNDGNYEPSNCRWADNKTQCNNRNTNIRIKIGNATKTLTEWCEIFELDSRNIFARYYRNGFISVDELFNKGK